jgi:uncharacterized protein (UPF0332 family)
MPIEPDDLLALAERLVGSSPGAPEADLRRGISTAYYALFHLLIKDAMRVFIADADFRPRVGRALQHGPMKKVCERYKRNKNKAGKYVVDEADGFPEQVISEELQQVAQAFFDLHQTREEADYDDSKTIEHQSALEAVQKAQRPSRRGWRRNLTCLRLPSSRSSFTRVL